MEKRAVRVKKRPNNDVKYKRHVLAFREQRIVHNYTWLAGLVVIILMLIIFSFVYRNSQNLEKKSEELDKQITQYQEKIEEQEARKEQLYKYSIFITTKQFQEEFAREKLGLVYEDELIFRPKDE